MKKILIIGGGISGLTAGIYAQKCGFESTIFEKHAILGGECTGWDRGEYHIDGCIHWLTGTKHGDPLNELWKQVGALENVEIYSPDRFITVEHEGKQGIIYRDLNLLKKHFLELSPEDEKEIETLIEYTKLLDDSGMPCDKPFDMMNIFDYIKLGKSMKNTGKIQRELSKISAIEYCSRFKSAIIRKALSTVVPSTYNASSLFFTLATFTSGNGDWPFGGSRLLAKRMEEKYLSLGGTVKTNSEVDEIIVENGIAKTIKLKNGKTEEGDYIIPACDTNVVYSRLLRGKYIDKKFAERHANPKAYPLSSCVYMAFAVDYDLKDYPDKLLIETTPFSCGKKTYNELLLHHYCFDNFAPKDKSILISTIVTDEDEYMFWKELRQNVEEYRLEKNQLSGKVIAGIENRFPELKGKIKVIDVATPVTYERYCGAYKGSWMAFGLTAESKQMIHDGRIKGIKNLYMAGQWLMPPGGLPVALVTGKWAIQRICKNTKYKPECF